MYGFPSWDADFMIFLFTVRIRWLWSYQTLELHTITYLYLPRVKTWWLLLWKVKEICIYLWQPLQDVDTVTSHKCCYSSQTQYLTPPLVGMEKQPKQHCVCPRPDDTLNAVWIDIQNYALVSLPSSDGFSIFKPVCLCFWTHSSVASGGKEGGDYLVGEREGEEQSQPLIWIIADRFSPWSIHVYDYCCFVVVCLQFYLWKT